MRPISVPKGLERDGVALRTMRARDAAPFAQAFRDDPDLGILVGAETDPSEHEARRYITRLPRLRARGVYLGLAITDATHKPFLGHVMLHTFDWHHRRAEVGYWLVPAARGKRMGRSAVGLLVDWAFHALEMERLEITTTPDN